MKTKALSLLISTLLVGWTISSPTNHDQSRPYHAAMEYVGLGFPIGVYMGGGIATHLGESTESGTYRAGDFVGPGLLHLTGEGTKIAANGDTLTYTFDEIVDFNTVPFTADGTFVFTGGTGRFAGATGGGTFHTVGTPIEGGFNLGIDYTGTISY